jgi:5-formyltetrahydrofolate cyclo-ligase
LTADPALSPATTKAALRTATLARRDALDPRHRQAAATALAAHALQGGDVNNRIVAGFWPIRSEIDTRPLMQALAARGAVLALPCVVSRTDPLMFRAFTFDTPLEARPFGLFEPPADHTAVIPDIVLVPLAAFDRRGYRIGYGAGHYDRTFTALEGIARPQRIGLGFALQELPEVPAEPHDVPLDAIWTEEGVIACPAGRR